MSPFSPSLCVCSCRAHDQDQEQKSLFRPVLHEYPRLPGLSDLLAAHERAIPLPPHPRLAQFSAYFHLPLAGARATMYAREGLVLKLLEAAARLPDELCFVAYDVFRSTETQRALFQKLMADVRRHQPSLTGEALVTETRKYCSDPDDPARRFPSPHNTGGAIDLAIARRSDGTPLFFGCEFDNTTELSRTDFFEAPFNPNHSLDLSQWNEARDHRRLLFNLMKDAGFTNYSQEWWHYDLGNPSWGKLRGENFVYGAMEGLV